MTVVPNKKYYYSPVVIHRTLRPYVILLSIVLWLGHRLFFSFLKTTADDEDRSMWHPVLVMLYERGVEVASSLMEWWSVRWDTCSSITEGEETIFHRLWESSYRVLLQDITYRIVWFMVQLFLDVAQFLWIMTMLRLLYCLYHFPSLGPSWIQNVQDAVYDWAKYHVTPFRTYLQKETSKLERDIQVAWCHDDVMDAQTTVLPVQGRPRKDLLTTFLHQAQIEDAAWKTGQLSGTVYTQDMDHWKFLQDIYGIYSMANTLHAGVWPQLNQCERQVIQMTADLLHNPTGIGCTTLGGTESIFLAIKAHWVYYGHQRGIRHPELICASTAHAAVDKACELLGIAKICLTVDSDYKLDPQQVRQHVTTNTIMIYASAPNYPQGTIDPISELGSIAQDYNIGMHVDACLGGFVLPFLTSKDNVPIFDFRIPGVTSMSADTHKFGYAPKGTSVVLYRHTALRQAQYFAYAHWTGGMYATPTLAGSRPSALVGCAWASMMSLGRDGYEQRSRQIVQATQQIATYIQTHMTESLFLLGNPVQEPSMIVCFGSHTLNIYRIADAMKERGWSLSSLQHPASVHICVTHAMAPQAKRFGPDLHASVQQVLREKEEEEEKEKKENSNDNNKKKHKDEGGTAGMYGMAGSLPKGPVNDFLRMYIDVSLTSGGGEMKKET